MRRGRYHSALRGATGFGIRAGGEGWQESRSGSAGEMERNTTMSDVSPSNPVGENAEAVAKPQTDKPSQAEGEDTSAPE